MAKPGPVITKGPIIVPIATPPARATISVIIPTRNEARNLPFVLDALPAGIDEVILVDGRSVDDTVAVARRLRPDIVVLEQRRRGKGNALAAGFAAAAGDYLVMIDADGSMDPGEIPAFIAALDRGADYAKGSRFTAGGGSDDISPLRRIGNRALNAVTNLLFATRYTDLCYGYNAFRRACVGVFALADPDDTAVDAHWGDGFEIETLINVRVAKAGMTIREVPSFEHRRRFGVSNLRTFRDGTRVLMTILRERLAGPADAAPPPVTTVTTVRERRRRGAAVAVPDRPPVDAELSA